MRSQTRTYRSFGKVAMFRRLQMALVLAHGLSHLHRPGWAHAQVSGACRNDVSRYGPSVRSAFGPGF